VADVGRFEAECTYESNIAFALRFMIDTDIVGGNWVEVPKSKYLLCNNKSSNAQIEIDVCYEELISHKPIGDWGKLAPMRILSFGKLYLFPFIAFITLNFVIDIECAGRDGIFPEPEHDPVIQIANFVTIQGQSTPFVKNVFVLGTCAPLVGSDVRCFKTEREMLKAWRDFIVEVDPDILTGYNILNFDIPYLLDRAENLGVKEFPRMCRIVDHPAKIKKSTFSSKAYGTRETNQINILNTIIITMHTIDGGLFVIYP